MPLGRELAAANRREVVASQTCAKSTAAAGAASRAGAGSVLRVPPTIAEGTAAAGCASRAGALGVLGAAQTFALGTERDARVGASTSMERRSLAPAPVCWIRSRANSFVMSTSAKHVTISG